MKRLILILGDQLTLDSPLLKHFDANTDEIIMIESQHEADYVWSHKAKIALFLSAMRHFAQALQAHGYPLTYIKESKLSITQVLQEKLQAMQASHLCCVEPGEWRLKSAITDLASTLNVHLHMPDDAHFYCSNAEFRAWAADKKELRLEYFYRAMRKKHGILIDAHDQPVGGQWNFDEQNRKPYSKHGPGLINDPLGFEPDAISREVFDFVEKQYPKHPGELAQFAWPVTREQALAALEHFVCHRLAQFGAHQDAMWKQTPFGWHAVLASSLNLKLLNPREVIERVLHAYQEQALDLAAVEGFIRQILGWREFIRGMYYLDMPAMAEANHYQHHRPLPSWYWTGQSKMHCMQDTVGQTLKYGYAHHIQRLMITGNFALLAELSPKQVSDWYLAVYVDAIEWVELPNVAGMALFANGGRFTSKPYVASGAYVKRMSNYCDRCPYKPELRYGEQACPMTNLYWHFLIKHQATFQKNPRTRLMTANLAKISPEDQQRIIEHAQIILQNSDAL